MVFSHFEIKNWMQANESWSKSKLTAIVLIKGNLLVHFMQLDKFLLDCIYCTNVEVIENT